MVIAAAFLGALASEIVMVADNLVYNFCGKGYAKDLAESFGYILAMPSAMIGSALRYERGLINAYAVNGLLGALLFGMIAWVWQFVFRAGSWKGD